MAIQGFGPTEEPLEKQLQHLLNRFSQENASNTPDFILAQYLLGCLGVFETAVQHRENWWGRSAEYPHKITRFTGMWRNRR